MELRTLIVVSAQRMAAFLMLRMGIRPISCRVARWFGKAARIDLPVDIVSGGERSVQETVLQITSAGSAVTVFDVGANVGHWSCSLLECWEVMGREDALCIHAFEPVSATADMLRQRLSDRPRRAGRAEIAIINKALSDVEGGASIHVVTPGWGGNAIDAAPSDEVSYSQEVALTTVAAYCSEVGIHNITLLKIDTEGYDVRVLRGARELFEAMAIDAVQFEYNSRWIWSRSFLHDVFDFLSGLPYRAGKVTPWGIEFHDRWTVDLENFVECNYLIVKEDLVPKFRSIRPWCRTER